MVTGASAYGDVMADIEAEPFNNPGDAREATDFLAELAGDGPVLELGIGLGRVALPLAERGIRVHGIEASYRMLEMLRREDGADRLQLHRGDFADVQASGSYRLIFAVFNTFFCLTTQEDQAHCIQRAAAKLESGGHLVLQVARYANWNREPFGSGSPFQVSVYRRCG